MPLTSICNSHVFPESDSETLERQQPANAVTEARIEPFRDLNAREHLAEAMRSSTITSSNFNIRAEHPHVDFGGDTRSFKPLVEDHRFVALSIEPEHLEIRGLKPVEEPVEEDGRQSALWRTESEALRTTQEGERSHTSNLLSASRRGTARHPCSALTRQHLPEAASARTRITRDGQRIPRTARSEVRAPGLGGPSP